MDIKVFLEANDCAIQALCDSTVRVCAFLPDLEHDTSFCTSVQCGALGSVSGNLKRFKAPTANQIRRQCINFMKSPVAFLLVGLELVQLDQSGPTWVGQMQPLSTHQAEDARVCFKINEVYHGVI